MKITIVGDASQLYVVRKYEAIVLQQGLKAISMQWCIENYAIIVYFNYEFKEWFGHFLFAVLNTLIYFISIFNLWTNIVFEFNNKNLYLNQRIWHNSSICSLFQNKKAENTHNAEYSKAQLIESHLHHFFCTSFLSKNPIILICFLSRINTLQAYLFIGFRYKFYPEFRFYTKIEVIYNRDNMHSDSHATISLSW